ncbi:hypothetical protein SAMN03159358_4488 [Paenibacillus sp. NFR01]|nr:hypothetical protein SAMN03159358_4488 [Paenibacillus sp. NFR01]
MRNKFSSCHKMLVLLWILLNPVMALASLMQEKGAWHEENGHKERGFEGLRSVTLQIC